MSDQSAKNQDKGSGQEVAKSGQESKNRFHVDYWKGRLFKKSYRWKGQRREVNEWSVRLQHLGRRQAFALGTANANVGAAKAKEIALFLEANGLELTMAKYKPSPAISTSVCTVGEFLEEVGTRSHLKPMTVRRYAVKLRKLVSDLARIEEGIKGRALRAKFDHVNGGHAVWCAKIDGLRLDLLTPESLNAWRNSYIARAGDDPLRRKSAERSAASYFRCVRSLFARDVVAALKVNLPPNPFAGVKIKDPGAQRYRSEINPEWLLTAADSELRANHPQQFLALFLCLWAGLRRKEADLLTWAQVDLEAGTLSVCRTAFFEPKTEESQRMIDLAPEAVDVLRSFKKEDGSDFVMKGGKPAPGATYDYYRADCTWRDLNAWLRSKGVTQRKAIHSLRKESGSLIASAHGIEAARQHLGHRDIRTTSNHYADKKKRIEITLSPKGVAEIREVAT